MGQLDIYNTLKEMNSFPKLENFKIISLLGKGGFSQVKKVKYYNPYIIYKRENQNYLAMKQMSKSRIIQLNFIQNIFNERDILLKLYNNNIINMYCTFQDKDNIYMIMDYMPGNDLRNLMENNKHRKFTEKEIIFIAAGIISGLEYIHSKNIIHRDIKPENLLFDSKYFLKIGDFGIAVEKSWNYINDNSGTLCYMAPERIGFFQNKNNYKYSFESDFYSLGIILYELVNGKKPFEHSFVTKEELLNNFSKVKNIQIVSEFYSKDLCDLINKLLIFDPLKRIGYNGVEEIKSHKIFENFQWKKLAYHTIKNPLLEKNNGLILKSKRNSDSKIDLNEERKDDFLNIDEKYQEKFKEYSSIHKLNISDILKPKILTIPNSFRIFSPLKLRNGKKINSLNTIKKSKSLLYENKDLNKNNQCKNKCILPEINSKIIKINSNKNIRTHFKLAKYIKMANYN